MESHDNYYRIAALCGVALTVVTALMFCLTDLTALIVSMDRFEDMALEDLDEEAIARMLEEADKEVVTEVDATGVKQLLLLLERKINRNQMMRVKFPEKPERFVDSEVSDAFTRLFCVAFLLLLLLLLWQ